MKSGLPAGILRGVAVSLALTLQMAWIDPVVGAMQEEPATEGVEDQAVDDAPAEAETSDPAAGEMRVRWQEWSRETFSKASQLRRPIMLYLRADDCRLCAELENMVLSRESVVRKIADTVVPVIADADLRPDLAARYLTGAVPTTIFLLPNGEPIYEVDNARSLERVGGYFRTPEGMINYLAQVEDYFTGRGKNLAQKAREVADLEKQIRDYKAGPPPLDRIDEIIQKVREGFDFTHGGYGRGWKLILDEPVRLNRFLAVAGDPAAAKAVATTVQGMLAGEIHDAVDGGFHHYATTREWGVPALEKRLQVNGQALRLLTAAATLDPLDQDVRKALQKTGAFVRDVLAREDGGLAFTQQGSLGPDDTGSYFQADAAGRATLRPPAVVIRSQSAAMAVAAVGLMEAGAVLADDDLEQLGLAAVDFISTRLYAPGRGVARYLDREGQPRLRGVLEDQVAAMEAMLVAYQVRGRSEDLDRAMELLQFCRTNLRRPAGYFIDGVTDAQAVGAMRRPLVAASMNGRVALAAFRLAAITGDDALRTMGLEAIGALSQGIPRLSHADAAYALAVLAAAGPQVKVVLPAGADAGLRRAALLLPAPGVAVSHEALLADEGVSLCLGADCSGSYRTAEELVAALKARQAAAVDSESDQVPVEEPALEEERK